MTAPYDLVSRCETCAFWLPPGDDYGTPPRAASMLPACGRCLGVGMAVADPTLLAAVYVDDRTIRPMLLTAATFACALWQAKPDDRATDEDRTYG